METNKRSSSWISLFLVTFLAAYLYIFNEWLFAITKPSYMNNLNFIQQLQVFFTVSALLAGLCFLCLLVLVILSFLPPLKKYLGVLIRLGALLPAVIFAALILVMVDNFTYTVFKFGIVSAKGWSRGLYGLSFILIIVLCYWRTSNALLTLNQRSGIAGLAPKSIFGLLSGILVLSMVVLALPSRIPVLLPLTYGPQDAGKRPHILLITADGLDASHTSLYGLGRETTPQLKKLAESALVAENAFSNCSNSTGSVISIYTGKYPAKTRVLYPPDILKGDASYEHLPGILRSQGYRTVQITLPFYLDPVQLNVLEGFDNVKMSIAEHSKYLNILSKALPNDKALFADEAMIRIADRIRHIFFIKEMVNPYLLVVGTPEQLVDLERFEYLKEEIRNATQPIFVHIHLMITHGEKFRPSVQKFSVGQVIETQGPWNDDFYDDSILDLDTSIGELVDYLINQGLLEKTILIIGSDHGQRWDSLKRLPFLMRFPEGQYAGRIRANVQNLDIAPTILDFLDLEQPSWMRGKSLIAGELEQRPIFGVIAVEREWGTDGAFTVNWQNVSGPFFQFRGLTLIYCQKWYKVNLATASWETGSVEGSTSVCPQSSGITDEQAMHWILRHLKENGFDVSTLDHLSPPIN